MEYDNFDEDDDIFNQQPASPSDSDYFSTGPMDEDPPSPCYPLPQQQQQDGVYITSSMDLIEFDMFANNIPSLGLFLTGQFTILTNYFQSISIVLTFSMCV